MLYKIIEFKKNLEGEIKRLQKNVTIGEAIRLKEFINSGEIDGLNASYCIYGAMTGHCENERAIELKGSSTDNDGRYEGALNRFKGMSPIEILLVAVSVSLKYNMDKQTELAQHIYNAITGGAIDWPYFEKEINKLFTV